MPTEDVSGRVDGLDWQHISDNLDKYGNAQLSGILSPSECDRLAAMYPDDKHFFSPIVLERYPFGRVAI